MTPRTLIGMAVAFALGSVAWLGVSALASGGSPLDSGARMLLALGASGFLLAFFQGEARWESLLGLFAGQVAALCGQALLNSVTRPGPPISLQILFLVSYNLSAAAGGALGALARSRFGRTQPSAP